MCARTIRNNIYTGDIYDIKNIKIKMKMRKSTTRKKHRLPPRGSKYKRCIWTLGRRFSNRNEEKRSIIIYIDRKTREEIIVKIPGKKAEYIAQSLDLIERR